MVPERKHQNVPAFRFSGKQVYTFRQKINNKKLFLNSKIGYLQIDDLLKIETCGKMQNYSRKVKVAITLCKVLL